MAHSTSNTHADPRTSQREGNDDGDICGAEENTPLLKAARLQSKRWTHRITISLQDWFSWEILSALMTTASIAIIITILALFDDSSLPDWPFVFTVRSDTCSSGKIHPTNNNGSGQFCYFIFLHYRKTRHDVGHWIIDFTVKMALV